MRQYSYVFSTFWTSKTGRALRKHPHYIRSVATYLITCGNTQRIGIYYLPKILIVHEAGVTEEEMEHALRVLSELGFADYDDNAELVLVHEMAKYQLLSAKGDALKSRSELDPKDSYIINIHKQLALLPESDLLKQWFCRYGSAFHVGQLMSANAAVCGGGAPPQAPSRGGVETPSRGGPQGDGGDPVSYGDGDGDGDGKTAAPPHPHSPTEDGMHKTAGPTPPGFGAGGSADAVPGGSRELGNGTGNAQSLADQVHSLVGRLGTGFPPGSRPTRGYCRSDLESLCAQFDVEYVPPRRLSSNTRKLLVALERHAPWSPSACIRAAERVVAGHDTPKLNHWLHALGAELVQNATQPPPPGELSHGDPH